MPKPGFRTAEFLWGDLIFSTAFTTNVNSFLTILKNLFNKQQSVGDETQTVQLVLKDAVSILIV